MITIGDALTEMRKLDDNSVDLIFTDPPYALGSETIIRADGKPDFSKAVDFMDKWAMPDGMFWEGWFKEAARVLKHGGWLILYGMDRQLLIPKYYGAAAGFKESQSIYWYFIQNFPKASDLSSELDWNYFITEAQKHKIYWDKKEEFGKTKAGKKKFRDWLDGFLIEIGMSREIIGKYQFPDGCIRTDKTGPITNVACARQENKDVMYNITAPATALAKKYNGYKYSIAPLKQCCETIMVFQKPTLTGSVLHDCIAYEAGDKTISVSALDIDGNRVPTNEKPCGSGHQKHNGATWQLSGKQVNGNTTPEAGRYPAQAFCDPDAAEILDKQSGQSKGNDKRKFKIAKNPNNWCPTGSLVDMPNYTDVGGCSKILHKCQYEKSEHDIFLYEPKVSKSERNKGCQDTPDSHLHQKNFHPCCKPIDLNRRILALFKTPNPQRIIIPFAGSGSEIIGALRAGYTDITGIEINPEYVLIANARIDEELKQTQLFELAV